MLNQHLGPSERILESFIKCISGYLRNIYSFFYSKIDPKSFHFCQHLWIVTKNSPFQSSDPIKVYNVFFFQFNLLHRRNPFNILYKNSIGFPFRSVDRIRVSRDLFSENRHFIQKKNKKLSRSEKIILSRVISHISIEEVSPSNRWCHISAEMGR